MKEDKENTRPKEKKVEIKFEDAEKTEKPKEKKETMTKVKLASYVGYGCYKSIRAEFCQIKHAYSSL